MFHYLRRLVTFLISLLKRLCRRKHKETPILPSAFDNKTEDEGWDEWEPMTSIKIDKKKEEEEEAAPPVDFFADMVPEFKQPAQIRIRTTTSDVTPATTSGSRLAVDTNFALGVGGSVSLGELDDSDTAGGWGEEDTALDDNEIIAVKNEALKKKRASEREKRRKEKERSSKLS